MSRIPGRLLVQGTFRSGTPERRRGRLAAVCATIKSVYPMGMWPDVMSSHGTGVFVQKLKACRGGSVMACRVPASLVAESDLS